MIRVNFQLAVAAVLLFPFSLRSQRPAAGLNGTVLDQTGLPVPHASLELDSGRNRYQAQADDNGAYQFSGLIPGEYTLTARSPGFKTRVVKALRLSGFDRHLDVPLDVGLMACGQPVILDRIPLTESTDFGQLTGIVEPSVAGIEVTLVCRTFSPCKSTKTDSRGRFTFEMLSPGVYGANVHRDGFYTENATEYLFSVNAGWESVYSSVRLQRCSNGNCDPKLRPQRPLSICE